MEIGPLAQILLGDMPHACLHISHEEGDSIRNMLCTHGS
jgi:hypothetical protein